MAWSMEEVGIEHRENYGQLMKKGSPFDEIISGLKGEDELSTKDVISIDDLSVEDISLIFRLAYPFKRMAEGEMKKHPLLKGKTIINFFFETSTRTKLSFELAGKHLGADVINVSGASSSMAKKGESLVDTARTLNAMKADIIILRHSSAGTPLLISKHVRCPVINAGDGWNEHPTQALLDAFTISERLGTVKGKTVVIVGDILHSRVAGSLMRILPKLGAVVRVCGPPTFIPKGIENVFKVSSTYDIDQALKGADVIYSLRVQTERAASGFIPTIREYSKSYCINMDRLCLAKKDAIVMHPGPVIREVDLRSEVMEHPRCAVEDQVTNGFAVRLALLYLLGHPGKMKEVSR